MGFLDHSTNNIIVDAVLTDYGRSKLAANENMTEVITSYGFADDEVDYTMIKKYGLIVGKEKIEKNTPVFEASTNAEYGVEYFIFTSDSPLLPMSTLGVSALSTGGQQTNTLNNDISTVSYTGSLSSSTSSATAASFTVSYDKRFLTLFSASFSDPTPHPTNSNRQIATTAEVTSFNLEFKRAADGNTVLTQRGVASEMTQFSITSNVGHIFHQTVEVSY